MPEAEDGRPELILKVLKHLFDLCVEDNSVEVSQRSQVSLMFFLDWVSKASPDAYSLAADLDVDIDIVEDVKTGLLGPNAESRVMGMWPSVIFHDRDTNNKLRALNVTALMQYDDGTVVPLGVYAHKDVTRGDLDDAAVMTVMSTYMPQLAQQLTYTSLDDFYAQYVGNYRGLCDRLVFDALEDAINSSESDGATKAKMAKMVSFIKHLLPPEVPGQILKHHGRDLDPNEVSGGWNVDK